MPFDDYIITRDKDKLLLTIKGKDFGYTITMNKNFQIIYINSFYCSNNGNPLKIYQMINSLNNYIKRGIKINK